MARTIYIAGKITGDPNYKEKFAAAQKELEAAGYVVLNPAWLPSEGFEYDAYMRMSTAMLYECEEVCFLSNWKESKGAINELTIALENDKEVHFLGENEKHGYWADSFDGITPVCSVCGKTHSCIKRCHDY